MALVDEIGNIVEKDLLTISQDYINNDTILKILPVVIDTFLKNYQSYINYINTFSGNLTIDQQKKIMDKKIELIYSNFFVIQNLFNEYLGQKIVLTQVYTDSQGYRKIYVSENTNKNLLTVEGQTPWGAKYAKVGYDLNEHEKLLKNSLPDQENEGLQETAREVERRYNNYKKRVLWKINENWKGYRLHTRGPINEAFVNFYIHNIQLTNRILDNNINGFMVSKKYGAINADGRKGFLIGDVEKDGIQLAVKGGWGSPQGFIEVTKAFQQLKKLKYTKESFQNFINKWWKEEKEKTYKSQLSEMEEKEFNRLVRKMEKDLTK